MSKIDRVILGAIAVGIWLHLGLAVFDAPGAAAQGACALRANLFMHVPGQQGSITGEVVC